MQFSHTCKLQRVKKKVLLKAPRQGTRLSQPQLSIQESNVLMKASVDRLSIADQTVGGTGSIARMGGRAGAILDRLVQVELPPGASGCEKLPMEYLPSLAPGGWK